jgi:hypothetical protein
VSREDQGEGIEEVVARKNKGDGIVREHYGADLITEHC